MSPLPNFFLSSLLGNLSSTLMLHVHLTILISCDSLILKEFEIQLTFGKLQTTFFDLQCIYIFM